MVTNIERAVEELKKLNDQGDWNEYFIGLCFDVIRDHPDPFQKCYGAALLSKIVKPGLAKKTQQLLKDHPQLPLRVHEILEASILRMAGY